MKFSEPYCTLFGLKKFSLYNFIKKLTIINFLAYFGNNGLLLEKLNNETDKALPVILGYDITAKLEDIPFINNEVKKFYFKNKPVTYESAMGLINVSLNSIYKNKVNLIQKI